MPDRIDIFNRKKIQEEENKEMLSLDDKFQRIVEKDFADLRSALSNDDIVYHIINEQYNFVDMPNFGSITIDDFINLASQILPREYWKSDKEASLRKVYYLFTGDKSALSSDD